MLILGIDTTTATAALALQKDELIIGELNVRLERTHSTRLLPNIRNLFDECNEKILDLDAIAAATGPGSFTGIRIGLSAVRAFAQVYSLPVIGVSTLELMAAAHYPFSGRIIPMIDARRQRVYTSIFKGGNRDIQESKLYSEEALTIEELIARLNNEEESQFLLTGEGAYIYKDKFQSVENLEFIFASSPYYFPRGAVLASLASYYFSRNRYETYQELRPRYLKKTQAEINWQKRQGK